MASKNGQIAAVVSAYFVISIALVFANKVLMTEGTAIPAPMFVTWFQCVITCFICWLLGEAGKGASKESFFAQFPQVGFQNHISRKIMPLSLMFVAMIALNNLCLQYVEVSFYNVARSLTIVFNVVFTWMFLRETTSSRVMMTLLVVIVGFFVGSDGEINFSLLGTIFGVTSSAFVSLNSIYTKRKLPVVNNNKWLLTWYNNLNACVLFLPLIIGMGEIDIILNNLDILFSVRYWIIMGFTGILGFMIGIVVVMQINLTSPLTHNISGTAKACVQTMLALLIWQNPTTFKAMLGVFMVVFGSMLYAWIRQTENAAPAKPVAAVPRPLEGLPRGGGEQGVQLAPLEKSAL